MQRLHDDSLTRSSKSKVLHEPKANVLDFSRTLDTNYKIALLVTLSTTIDIKQTF